MAEAPTTLSRAATAALATLAMTHLASALTQAVLPAYARVILLATCWVTAVAAVVLLRHDSYGSRLVVWVVAVLSAGGAVLVAAVGLPGAGPSGLAGTEAVVVVLALVTGVLLGLDARLRRPGVSDRPPYAL